MPTPHDETLRTIFDVLVWDERHAWCSIWEWPTRIERTYFFVPPHSTEVFYKSAALHVVLDGGWEIISCSVLRYGFLWLKESRVWTFKKKVGPRHNGDELWFVRQRVTPGMFKDEDEGLTWTDG